jgi:hypothetical protein
MNGLNTLIELTISLGFLFIAYCGFLNWLNSARRPAFKALTPRSYQRGQATVGSRFSRLGRMKSLPILGAVLLLACQNVDCCARGSSGSGAAGSSVYWRQVSNGLDRRRSAEGANQPSTSNGGANSAGTTYKIDRGMNELKDNQKARDF